MPQSSHRIRAADDLDAKFICVEHGHTAAMIDHLRLHGIKFSVDVEPQPPGDQADDDFFWFESTLDFLALQNLIDTFYALETT